MKVELTSDEVEAVRIALEYYVKHHDEAAPVVLKVVSKLD